jgi:hypothetical protein
MQDEKPPFLNTWTNVYLLLVAVLVLVILALYFITQYFL